MLKKLLVTLLAAGLILFLLPSAALATKQVATFDSVDLIHDTPIDNADADGLVVNSSSGKNFYYYANMGANDSGAIFPNPSEDITWMTIQLVDNVPFDMLSFYYDNTMTWAPYMAKAIVIEGIRDSTVKYTSETINIYGSEISGTIDFTDWNDIDTLKITPAESGDFLNFYIDDFTYEADITYTPSDITLSNSSIEENSPTTATVGSFSTTDEDPDDSFTYTLASGTGSTDNTSFAIDDDTLKLSNISLDYETKNSYSIRVRSTDSFGLYFEKTFTITVTDVDESTPIASAGVTGIVAPAAGGTPQTAANLTPGSVSEYAITSITWQNSDGTAATLTSENKFKAGSTYKAEIKLTSETGYKFPAAGLTPTANTGTPTAGTVSGGDVGGNALTFAVAFPATAALSVSGIAVTSQPTKLSYVAGETLDLSGLLITLSYNDGTTKTGIGPLSLEANGITTDPTASTPLTVKDHNGATIAVTCNAQTDQTSALSITAASYTLSASPASKDFGRLTVGYAPVSPATVTATNTGNQPITLSQPTSTDYTVGTISTSSLKPAESATFTVCPREGLSVGTYAETLQVSGSGSAQVSVTLNFTVLEVEYDIKPDDDDNFYLGGTAGKTFTSNGTFSSFRGVSVDGTPLAASQYNAQAGSTVVTLLPAYLNTLSAGSHTLSLLFSDGHANTVFNILASPDVPQTGDSQPIVLYIILGLVALGAIILILRLRRR